MQGPAKVPERSMTRITNIIVLLSLPLLMMAQGHGNVPLALYERENKAEAAFGSNAIGRGTSWAWHTPRTEPPVAPARNSIGEWRISGLGVNYYGRVVPGASLEFSLRDRQHVDGVDMPGRLSVGIQAGYYPRIAVARTLPFRIGHLSEVVTSSIVLATPEIRFGNVPMTQGRLFLIPADGGVFVSGNAYVIGPGIWLDRLAYEKITMRDVQVDMATFNVPLRWFMGPVGPYKMFKPYLEVGAGADILVVTAHYDMESVVLEHVGDGQYTTRYSNVSDVKPTVASMGANMWYMSWSFGGGMEVGRFNVFLHNRFMLSSQFHRSGQEYDRIRGNALAMPIIAGAAWDDKVLRRLDADGAIAFGSTTEGSNSAAQSATKNGVDRFRNGRYLSFGVGFRLSRL